MVSALLRMTGVRPDRGVSPVTAACFKTGREPEKFWQRNICFRN